MEKKLLKQNNSRHVQEILWGFDPFMKVVINESMEMTASGEQNNTEIVVTC